MGSQEFLNICKAKIAAYFNEHRYCKTLQNHKALLSTTATDGMYYEMTFNGDMNELYMDAYKKWQYIGFDM